MSDTSVAITAGVGTAIAVEVQNAANYQVVVQGAHLATPYTEAAINAATNGDNVLVAAVALKTVKLFGLFLMATGGAVNVRLLDGAGGTQFFPALSLLGNGAAWWLLRDGNTWVTTTAGNGLILNLSGAIQVSGRLYYVQA